MKPQHTKTVLETLEDARKLIALESAWVQGVFGKTADGHSLTEDDLREGYVTATCFCGSGAIMASGGALWGPAWRAVNREMGMGTISAFNDTHTHAEVLRAFDEAIAAEKAKVTA